MPVLICAPRYSRSVHITLKIMSRTSHAALVCEPKKRDLRPSRSGEWRSRIADPAHRVVLLLSAAAALSIVLADASLMSKAEVERIWLPFVPWLLVACALLPESWRKRGLVVQIVVALAIQHLLSTGW